MVRDGVHAVAVDRQDDEVVLALRFLGDGQTEDLVDVPPRDGKLDAPTGTNGPHAAVFLVNQLEGEFLALRDREADAGI